MTTILDPRPRPEGGDADDAGARPAAKPATTAGRFRLKSSIAIPIVALSLAACGGGGSYDATSHSNPNPNGTDPSDPGIDPLEEVNVSVLSDAIFDLDDRRARTNAWACREDLSFICMARLGQLQAYADPRGEFTYRVLGEWEHLHVAGVVHTDTVLFAVTAGVSHPDSLPAGGATWTGSMVGVYRPPETPMDVPGEVVRGGAEIMLADIQDPVIDVVLTPQGHPEIAWTGVRVEDGAFSEYGPTTTDAPWPGPPNRANYIRGEFYGPGAEELGGVFERAGIVGAFAGQR